MKNKSSCLVIANYCVCLFVLFCGALMGCSLGSPVSHGEVCPPGIQMLDDGAEPYVLWDNMKCYEKFFIVYENPFVTNYSDEGNCCVESYDESGVFWQCFLVDECIEPYGAALKPGYKSNFVNCQNYKNADWFKTKSFVTYSVTCSATETCDVVENPDAYCPIEFEHCSFNQEYGFFCSSACSAPLLSCPDENSADPTVRLCIQPENDIWHCGANGSCSDDSEINYKGAVCNKGTMVCENHECVCPEHYLDCGDGCIDVYNNPENCGGCAVNDSTFRCADDEACIGGECVKHECSDNSCSIANCNNSKTQCGRNCKNCEELPYVIDSFCLGNAGQCVVSQCAKGFHIISDASGCEMNSSERCAPSDSSEIKNCSEEIPNSERTICDWNGHCWVKECKNGYAMEDNRCFSQEDLCKSENHEQFINHECSCEIGYAACYDMNDGMVSNFRCVNLLTDDLNCGECDHPCSDGLTCKQAQCQ